MSTLNIPDATYARIAERAAKLGVTVEELVLPLIEQAAPEPAPAEPTQAERMVAFKKMQAYIESLADRFPPGHQVDVSREAI
jgi:hypothetical protein